MAAGDEQLHAALVRGDGEGVGDHIPGNHRQGGDGFEDVVCCTDRTREGEVLGKAPASTQSGHGKVRTW